MNDKTMKGTLKILKALSDETRLKIVEFLLDGEKCVCEIFPRMKRTQSTVSIQLGKLEDAGILKSRRKGKKIFYSISDMRVVDVFKALGNEKGKLLKKKCCKNEGELHRYHLTAYLGQCLERLSRYQHCRKQLDR